MPIPMARSVYFNRSKELSEKLDAYFADKPIEFDRGRIELDFDDELKTIVLDAIAKDTNGWPLDNKIKDIIDVFKVYLAKFEDAEYEYIPAVDVSANKIVLFASIKVRLFQDIYTGN